MREGEYYYNIIKIASYISVAFFSQKLAFTKLNYKIYNKELLTIIKYFKQ